MTRSGVLATAATALSVGLLVALTASNASLLAFEVWFGVALFVFGASIMLAVLRVAASEPVAARPIWRRAGSEAAVPTRPTVLVASDRLVAGSLRQPRLFDTRLRPRLVALLAHASVASDDLGDTAWILNDDVRDRAPTEEELTTIFDLLERRP